MANIEWFKFISSEWLGGSIQLLSPEEKGTFIDLCAIYWKNDCCLTFTKVLSRKLRVDHATACDRINSLCELDIVAMQNEELSIKFLDLQKEDIQARASKNSENAKKRWSNSSDSMQPHANKKKSKTKNKIEDKEEDKDKKDQNARPRFIPPTIEDVASYCLERNNGVDSVKWHNFYSSKGWMVGSNKMKDWKAAVRTWETKKTTAQTSGWGLK